MTILEALEKAKRIRDERARLGTPEPSPRRPVGYRKAADLPSAPAPKLDVERLTVDPEVYERNRVLINNQAQTYSAVLDAYRILRTRLWHRGVGSDRGTSFGVISAGPGEGKTLTTLNLALAFARERKHNVFLLDLDLRNPSVCKYLGVAPKVEIGSVLNKEAKPQDALFSIGVDNLFLAGGLNSYENSTELLGGEGLAGVLARINEMDPQALILVDLPPILSSADAMVVAPKLSAVLLVVAEGQTKREQLDRAVEILSGSNVAGIVLNRSRESLEDYYS
jgi:protein-tyrosine kinase